MGKTRGLAFERPYSKIPSFMFARFPRSCARHLLFIQNDGHNSPSGTRFTRLDMPKTTARKSTAKKKLRTASTGQKIRPRLPSRPSSAVMSAKSSALRGGLLGLRGKGVSSDSSEDVPTQRQMDIYELWANRPRNWPRIQNSLAEWRGLPFESTRTQGIHHTRKKYVSCD